MALESSQPLVKMGTRNIPGAKGARCVRLTSPPSRAECHEIWEPKPPGTLWATPGLLRDSSFVWTLNIKLYRNPFSNSEEKKCRWRVSTYRFFVTSLQFIQITLNIASSDNQKITRISTRAHPRT